ncbi:MAG TPA: condensation domain-containing protein [Candidatus Binataceae bacterium]
MTKASQRIADLSPKEKRALLTELLRKTKDDIESTYPLSFNQQGMWFLYQLAPESTVYNVTFSARIRSALDIDALRLAFQTLIERHPSLRTTFALASGAPVQRVHRQSPLDFVETDISTWTDEHLTARLADDAHRPFDLERGPVVRVRVFTRSERDRVLLMVVHHIVIDFWSLAIVLNELSVLYPAHLARIPALLPEPIAQYSNYVRWQAEMLAGPQGQQLWKYWSGQLAGPLPELGLPSDRPRPPLQTYRGAALEFNLDAELSGHLRALARTRGVTLYMVLLAAFQMTLACLTGQNDMLIASPVVGRSRAEFEGVVGLFTNPVVLRANLSGNPTFQGLLARVRESVLAALDHQDYPSLLLVQRLRLPRELSRPPLAQVMFVLDKPHRLNSSGTPAFAQGPTGLQMNPGGLQLESFPLERRSAALDLVMLIIETTTSLSVSIRYNTDLFDQATITRIGGQFETVLRSVISKIDLKLNELKAILLAEDSKQVNAMREERRIANLQRLKDIRRRPVITARNDPSTILVRTESRHTS